MADTAAKTAVKSKNIKTINVDSAYLKDQNSETDVGYYLDNVPTIDIRYGGQWGALPRIGGVDNSKPIHEWMHEQAYLKRDVIPVLLQAPRGFTLLPNPEQWREAIKALFEVHSKTIEGLNSSLTVEHQEHQAGLSGASIREPGNVNREATAITLGGILERYGNPFEILLDVWIRYMIMDPDLKAPLITRVAKSDELPDAWTAEWYSCTVMFIEPDPLYRKPVHAWLVSNLYPSGNPDIIGKKDKTAGRELKELSLDMGGFALPPTNIRVKNLAANILNNLKLWDKNPDDILLPADSVDSDISNVGDINIYYDGVKKGTNDIGTADGTAGSATATDKK